MKTERKINRMVVMLCSLFIGLIIINIYYFMNPILYKSDHVEVGLNEKYDPLENIRMVFLSSSDQVSVNDDIDTSTLGEHTFHYEYKGNKYESTYTVVDKAKPELTLKSYETDTAEKVTADEFVDTCKDDSKCTYKILSKNVDQEGENTIVIEATDAYGNSTTATTTLTRTKDTTAPVVSEIASRINVLIGNEFDYDAALGATDDMDPNPTVTTSSKINFNKAGTYDVEYTISDRSGNTTSAKQTIQVIDATEQDAKVVYLTFDDGPSEENTSDILDILKKYNVKATFFVVGNCQSYPELVKREYEEGHTVGLHTFTHDYATVYASDDAYFQDLQQISDAVESIIGIKSTVIRFPGGSSNTVSAKYSSGIMTRLASEVEQRGYEYYDWDVSSGDASYDGVPASEIVSNVTGHTANQMTVLFHDSSEKNTSVEALEEIIEYYYNEGYVFLPLTNGTSYAAHQSISN